MKIPVEKIIFLQDIYPREEIDQEQVNLYRLNLNSLPPIIVNEDYILIDGAHRLRAHEISNKKEITAIVKEISKEDILLEAIKINNKHGKQLTMNDKRILARKLFDDQLTNEDIGDLLAVNLRTIQEWTKDKRQIKTKEQEEKILQLYLQAKTQEEIAKELEVSQKTISNSMSNSKKRVHALFTIPDSLQVSNIWRFSSRDSRFGIKDYPGSIPGQVIENFLYYFTDLFDLVVDPMAGGGTTIDVCKSMYRRYLAYDLNPLKTRLDIKYNDMTKGFPEECKNKKIDAIYLDPPYWHTKQYNEESVDKFSRKDYLDFIEKLAIDSHDLVKKDGVIGFICQDIVKKYPKLYKGNKDDKVLSMIHLAPLFEKTGLELEWRVHVPLHLGQYNAMKTAYAKEEKIMLNCVRDLLIWRK